MKDKKKRLLPYEVVILKTDILYFLFLILDIFYFLIFWLRKFAGGNSFLE